MRLNIKRQEELEPKRYDNSKQAIKKIGFETINIDSNQFNIITKKGIIHFFPYSGWHTGKCIKDGRGFKNLYNQLLNLKKQEEGK